MKEIRKMNERRKRHKEERDEWRSERKDNQKVLL